MPNTHFPPHIKKDDKVILFDGVCKLCAFWSRFIIAHDKHRIFKLASVQSNEGQDILRYFDMPTEHFDTMLYIVGNQPFQKSNAVLAIVSQLGLPWKLFSVLKIFPLGIRDWCYDRIAQNRYTLFGKSDYCVLPSPEHKQRFLNVNGSD